MAEGFKIASAFVDINVQDSTSAGIAKTTGNATSSMTRAASQAKAGISTVFGTLKGIAGPALAPLLEVGEGFTTVAENIEEHGKSVGGVMTSIGAGATAVGGVLLKFGSDETAATNQLKQAIDNTGGSYEDYEEKIESTVKANEKFGDTATSTKNALQTLVSSTGDTDTALNDMSIVTDLAASKHESLGTAATQVSRILGGSGARTLAQYDLQVAKNSDGTTNWGATLDELGSKLKGQAAAASDTFTGKMKALGVEFEDNIAIIGQKFGPVITGAGVALTALGVVT